MLCTGKRRKKRQGKKTEGHFFDHIYPREESAMKRKRDVLDRDREKGKGREETNTGPPTKKRLGERRKAVHPTHQKRSSLRSDFFDTLS